MSARAAVHTERRGQLPITLSTLMLWRRSECEEVTLE
jgi:hypothetical protein